MMKYESDCVCCGLPCKYELCPHYRVKAYYCDKCKDDTPAEYEYDGTHYCKDCLESKLDVRFMRVLSVSEKIEALGLEDEIREVEGAGEGGTL